MKEEIKTNGHESPKKANGNGVVMPKDGSPLLEYEKNLINELNRNAEDTAESGLCYTVVGRGFSVPKIVACMLYENYSCSIQ